MLPEGVEEILPPQSWQLEDARRRLLDHFRLRGYELIVPPLVEHLDALLTGAGSDLEAQTLKFTDPATGRLLALRADMTPQAARIVARRMNGAQTVRLCYLGSVLRAWPDGPGGSRTPMQVGCEIFGDAELSADIEIIRLMLESLELAGVRDIHLGLGHVGIFRALIEELALDGETESALFDLLQRKSLPDLQALAQAQRLPAAAVEDLATLMELNGGPAVLDQAGRLARNETVTAALASLRAVCAQLPQWLPASALHVDLAELRGYRYHTGIVFAAFTPGSGREIARGGRYDGAGRDFGVGRPATGFSGDIHRWLQFVEAPSAS
jgi:ATP phosphoribosyltransferase regulatory subunit